MSSSDGRCFRRCNQLRRLAVWQLRRHDPPNCRILCFHRRDRIRNCFWHKDWYRYHVYDLCTRTGWCRLTIRLQLTHWNWHGGRGIWKPDHGRRICKPVCIGNQELQGRGSRLGYGRAWFPGWLVDWARREENLLICGWNLNHILGNFCVGVLVILDISLDNLTL